MNAQPSPVPANTSAVESRLQQTLIHVANAQAALLALDQAIAQVKDAREQLFVHLDKADRA